MVATGVDRVPLLLSRNGPVSHKHKRCDAAA
jgi:hypothetical protein